MSAALQPYTSQESIERRQTRVCPHFDVEPIGRQAGRGDSKMHQLLRSARARVACLCTTGEMRSRFSACYECTTQVARARLLTMLFDEGQPVDCSVAVLWSFMSGSHINHRGGPASRFARPECFAYAMDSPDLVAVAAEQTNAAIEDLDAEDVVVGFQVYHVDLYWMGERRIAPFSLELMECFPLN